MLFRSLRRRTSIESLDLDEVCETEFRDREGKLGLRVSVYRLPGPRQLPQIHAEHCVTAKLRIKRMWLHADLDSPNSGAIQCVPIESPFAFARDSHHELEFMTEQMLRDMVAVVWGTPGSRGETATASVRDYVRRQLEQQDGEWATFCSVDQEWRQWATGAGR